MESSEKVDYFTWTWQFHEAVNRRLNKPIIDYETAKLAVYFKLGSDEERLKFLDSIDLARLDDETIHKIIGSFDSYTFKIKFLNR
jgi:hypothetical protein